MNTIIYNNSIIKNINSIQNFKLNTKNKYLDNNLIINIDTILNPPNDYFFIERTASQYFNNTISQIRENLFYNFSNLIEVSFPKCNYIGDDAFCKCSALTSVNFPQCSYIGDFVFTKCLALTSISFPQCNYIGSYAFGNCISLSSIYLMSNKVISLVSSNAFIGTEITSTTGSIIVPASLVNAYKANSVWSYFSNRIFGV